MHSTTGTVATDPEVSHFSCRRPFLGTVPAELRWSLSADWCQAL